MRPTADRVKESLFAVLGPRLEGARVLDLYAGTGNLGLEALSRGAATCLFVEKATASCAAIRDNIDSLGVGQRATVLRLDAARAPGLLAARGDRFTLVLADPPYAARGAAPSEFKKILLALDGCATLTRGALVAAEHSRFDAPPDGLRHLRLLEQRRYGETAVSFFAAP